MEKARANTGKLPAGGRKGGTTAYPPLAKTAITRASDPSTSTGAHPRPKVVTSGTSITTKAPTLRFPLRKALMAGGDRPIVEPKKIVPTAPAKSSHVPRRPTRTAVPTNHETAKLKKTDPTQRPTRAVSDAQSQRLNAVALKIRQVPCQSKGGVPVSRITRKIAPKVAQPSQYTKVPPVKASITVLAKLLAPVAVESIPDVTPVRTFAVPVETTTPPTDCVDGVIVALPADQSFVSDRTKEEHLNYFRDLVAAMTVHLTSTSSKWEKYPNVMSDGEGTAIKGHMSSVPFHWGSDMLEKLGKGDAIDGLVYISEDCLGLLNVAVGQARLFRDKKLQQFVGLIDDYESDGGVKPISPIDLLGFWEMISMQVRDIQSNFDKLDALAANDWIVLEVPTAVSVVDAPKNKPVSSKGGPLKPVNRKPKSVVEEKSNMREMIDEKRRTFKKSGGELNKAPEDDIANGGATSVDV